jgi:hypothetical protein
MVYFQTKNPNSGKFLEDLGMEALGIVYIKPFEAYYGHLGYFTFCVDLVRFSGFGIM